MRVLKEELQKKRDKFQFLELSLGNDQGIKLFPVSV